MEILVGVLLIALGGGLGGWSGWLFHDLSWSFPVFCALGIGSIFIVCGLEVLLG